MSLLGKKLVVPSISEKSSIHELISFIKSSFRQKDYDEVERLLISREEKLRMELSSLKRDYESMKKDHDLMEEKHGLVELKNLEFKEELEKWKLECETLMKEKREVEEKFVRLNNEFMEYDARVSEIEEFVAKVRGVRAEDIRRDAYCAWVEEMNAEILGNGVNIPSSEGHNEGLNLENLQNGVDNHVVGENGGFTHENLIDGFNDHVEHHQMNGLPQTQGPDFPNEGAAADGHDNAEIFSGARSVFDYPEVESNASDQEGENDESPNTDLNEKRLLQTKVGRMSDHNVVPSSHNVQAACDAPQVGTYGFSHEKGNKMLPSAGIQGQLVLETGSSSPAAASCIPISKTPGSLIIIESSVSDEESLPAGSADVSPFCASEVNSTGKEMPCINSEKSASDVKIQEENGSDSTKDSNIHLMPKRKRSMTDTDVSNFMAARRKTEYIQKLLGDGKGFPANDSSLKLDRKSAGCQEPILPSATSHFVTEKCQEKSGADGSLQAASTILLDDSDSENESCSDSFMELMLASIRRESKKGWNFAADMLSDFDKDYELCMNAVCALYRKKISAEKSLMKSSLPADLGFSHFDAMRGKQLAEFLIDGDPQLKLKRTVSEVQQQDPRVLSICKDLAFQYSEKLFEIYCKAEDPFFHPKL
ncbi:hypothetical protein ACH5RR_041695 [Cinchona calisaya]|uniref:FRIGIDA-like protein n=1 Tax=Cinchona calisaya TaxID=153742 RepID=A0ABD2XZQ3_9GENT